MTNVWLGVYIWNSIGNKNLFAVDDVFLKARKWGGERNDRAQ